MGVKLHRKEDIIDLLDAHQKEIASFGVKRIGLFGSFAKGKANEESDIDFLVEFKSGQKTFRRYMGLAFLLEDLFQRRIELVTRESLSPYLESTIIDEVKYVETGS